MPPLRKRPRPKPRPKELCLDVGEALALVVYGPPGVGKTSFASCFPKVGFLIDDQERGIHTLKNFGRIPKDTKVLGEVSSWKNLFKELDKVTKAGISTLALDSLTGFERLCFQYHCEENFGGDWSNKGFYNYYQGPRGAAKTDWPNLLSLLSAIQESGIHVVLIAHSTTRERPRPGGQNPLVYSPYMDKETWESTKRWAQGLLFMNYEYETESAGPREVPQEGSERRVISTEWSPIAEAKNWYGLEPVISMGDSARDAYRNFVTALMKAKEHGSE